MSLTLDLLSGVWNLVEPYITLSPSQGRRILDSSHVVFEALFNFFLYATIAYTTLYLVLLIANLVYKKKKPVEKSFDLEKAPFVTIQIPTRNEVIALRCASNCLDFDYPKDKYEVIIGDDSNDVSVSGKIDEFVVNNSSVRVMRRSENIGFKPGNLNNMLTHSKGEIIVIFDSDFTPGKDFLKRIVAPFVNDSSVSAVQAKWNFNNFEQNSISVLASMIVYNVHRVVLSFMSFFGSGFLCGSAEAVRKKDLVALGGWRSGSFTEDIEYSLRLFKNNRRIVYLPSLECYSEVPYIPKDLYKQQMRWAYGVVNATMLHSKDILFKRSVPSKTKLFSLFPAYGYLLPIFMLFLFFLGMLSFLTHAPEPINLSKFTYNLMTNIILTSGVMIVSMFVLYKEGKVKYLAKMVLSSFTFGIVTVYYVNKGIFKSILNKPMYWYLLSKGGTAKN